MANYLDALPQNSATGGGPGLASYASSLNQVAAAYAEPAADPVAAESAPVAST